MEQDAAIDVVWGVTGIAKVIRRSPRQTANMLAQGDLPAKKVTGRWCSSRRALTERLAPEVGRSADRLRQAS